YASLSCWHEILAAAVLSCRDWGRPRKHNMKDCTFWRGALNGHHSAVVLNNLVHHCQSQPGAVLFALANERIKQRCPHGFWYSVAVIGNINFDAVPNFAKRDIYPSTATVYSFASIQQQIGERSLQLTMVEPAFDISRLLRHDLNVTKLRVRLHCLYCIR